MTYRSRLSVWLACAFSITACSSGSDSTSNGATVAGCGGIGGNAPGAIAGHGGAGAAGVSMLGMAGSAGMATLPIGGSAVVAGTNVAGRGGSSGGSGAGGLGGAGGTSGAGGMGGGGMSGAGNSEILVPDQGVLLGQYYGAGTIAQTDTKLGRTPPIHLTYYAWDHDWTGDVTQDDLDAGRIPLVNWELYGVELDDILSGSYDSLIHERGASAKALGKKLFVDFGAEMNGEWSPWSGAQNGMSADKYLEVYRHVHDLMAEEGATNVVWVWCPNVTDEPRATWNQALNYYPGDDYVDWTCVDGYNWGSTNGGWQTFQEVFADVYETLATKGKPIMIGEMASAESGGDKGAWIDAIIPTLKDEFPMIKGLVWFDIDKETDWRISSSPEAEAAYVRLANDPYFNP